MNAIKIHRAIRIPVLALVLVGAVAGTALATTSTGFSGVIALARHRCPPTASTSGPTASSSRPTSPIDIITQQVTIAPSGTSGWHTHPGVVLVTVFAGTVTFYNEHCKATVYPAGSSFVESGDDPGLARNESTTTPVTVFATYIEPVGTTVLRIDAPNPGCSQN